MMCVERACVVPQSHACFDKQGKLVRFRIFLMRLQRHHRSSVGWSPSSQCGGPDS